MEQNEKNTSSQKLASNVVPAIVVMFLLYFMIAFVTGFAGSMGVIAKAQFEASNALSQLGVFANFIAYAIMGLPAGIILKRKGYKFTALTAVLVGLLGVAVQLISGYQASFALYITGAFIAGFSMCMLNTVVNPLLNTLGGGGNRGNQLNQFGGSCNSIGATLAPIIMGLLIGQVTAETNFNDVALVMYLAMGIFLLAAIIIAFTPIPEPHKETAEERMERLSGKKAKDSHSPLSFRHFVLGAVAIFFYVGIEVGIPNMSNLYMSGSETIGAAIAGVFVGAYWFLMMCGRLLGGAFGGKVSSKAMLVGTASLAIIFLLCLILIPETVTFDFTNSGNTYAIPVKMIFMVLCGLCTSVMWGSIFNLAVEGLGKYTPLASGIFMIMVCGGGVLPFLQGQLADGVGLFGSYWLLVAALAYLLFYALVGSKNVNKDIPVE